MDIENEVAVVTGAGQGIGRAVAQMLVTRGARVALIARRVDTLRKLQTQIDPSGDRTLAVQCDVAEESEVIDSFTAIRGEFGSVKILVNNAGVGTTGPVQVGDYSSAEFDRIVNVNLNGAFFCAREALRSMRELGAGCIINIASIAGIKAAPNVFPYSVSKFGMRALSETLRAENLMDGIKVHTISPGPTRTSIWEAKEEPLPDSVVASMLAPDDVAAVAEFMLDLPAHVRVDEIVVLPNVFPLRLWDYKLLEDA